MPDLIDPSEIMFTPFEPKLKNRFIMYIEGVPVHLQTISMYKDM